MWHGVIQNFDNPFVMIKLTWYVPLSDCPHIRAYVDGDCPGQKKDKLTDSGALF